MIRAIALVLAVSAASLAHAQAPKAAEPPPPAEAPKGKGRPNSVAVMDTVAQGVPDTLAALATQTITSYLANNLGLDVVAKDDVRKLVSFEQQKQLLGCESEACQGAANVGEALGVERLVTSTLGRIGERFQVSVVCMEVATSKVVGRSTREMRDESEIVENTRDLAHFVVKKEQRESKGYARISTSHVGAKIIIDGAEFGVAPLAAPARLLSGRHNVRVEKQGFLPFSFDFEIEAGKESPIEAKLIAKTEIVVAGSGYLPWAGATAGAAVLLAAASGYFYSVASDAYHNEYLKDGPDAKPSAGCPAATADRTCISQSDLKAAAEKVETYGNTYAYYGTMGAAGLGVLSVGLFTAYFVSGLGAGGDEPPAGAPMPSFVPTLNGFSLKF